MLNGKKILFLLPGLEMGGSERQAMILAEHLAFQHGANIEIWGVSGRGLVARECQRLGFPTKVLGFSWPGRGMDRLLALAALTRKLRMARPDIILPYTLLPSIACGCVWRFTGAKGCFWNQRDISGYRLGAFWERLAIRNVSGFIANGQHVGGYLQQTFAVPAKRINIILNGVYINAPQRDRDDWRRDLDCGDTDLMVVMVANLHRHKDHATLLSAWRIVLNGLVDQESSAVLVLAGLKGESFSELTALVDRLDIAASVRFPGQIDDISGLLEAADIGVFSSRTEGSPNGLLEYMAAGLPVVATDIPAVREAIGEDFAEVLSPIGDAQTLAKNLLTLAKSVGIRAQQGARNRQRVLTNFSTNEMVQRMANLMETCLRS